MAINRRQILQYSVAGSLLATLPLQAAAGNTGALRAVTITDAAALPRFAAGQRLVADTAHVAFGGDGIYFYPAWGTPRPWHVSLGPNQMLEFRNPGTGQLAWVQSASMKPQFAGKLADAVLLAIHSLPPLRVPAVPKYV